MISISASFTEQLYMVPIILPAFSLFPFDLVLNLLHHEYKQVMPKMRIPIDIEINFGLHLSYDLQIRRII